MSQSSWQPWQGKDESSPQSRPGGSVNGGVPERWQGGEVSHAAPQPWGGPSTPSMLASHADRERAVDVLRAGYGEGRMEKAEFDRRVGRAYAARTVGELALLVVDLPQGPVPQAAVVMGVPRTFLPLPRPRTNGKAVGAAVCGLLCLPAFGLTGIPAVILGHSARTEIERTGERGDGLALTGLVLGWLSIAGWAVLLTLMIAVGLATGT